MEERKRNDQPRAICACIIKLTLIGVASNVRSAFFFLMNVSVHNRCFSHPPFHPTPPANLRNPKQYNIALSSVNKPPLPFNSLLSCSAAQTLMLSHRVYSC